VSPLIVALESIHAECNTAAEPAAALRWWGEWVPLPDRQISALAAAAKTWLGWHRSPLRFVWPSYLLATRTLRAHCAVAIEEGREGMLALHEFLIHEVAQRMRCRRWEESQRKLGLHAPVANLRVSDLGELVAALIAQLQTGKNLLLRGQSCPHAEAFKWAMKSGAPGALREFLAAVQQGVARHALRRESLRRLSPLSPWMGDDWMAEVRDAIQQSHDTTEWISTLRAAWPSLADYQRFRTRAATMPADELAVLATLATKRMEWETLSADRLPAAVSSTIEREALLAWRSVAEESTPALLLDRQEFEAKIQQLGGIDARLCDATRKMLAQLSHPERLATKGSWDEVVMLTGPRARKLREVVDMGESRGLFELKPVWLANPDTVSRLFPLREGLFDVVIFDEASQLPVEFALPAIFRAKTVVVSGDDKQLPPSRFFSSGFDDDEEETAAEDEEASPVASRADRREVKDCGDLLELAAPVLPNVLLNVHYRSRYRQLIGFSNAAYYQGRLSVPVLHPHEEVRRIQPIKLVQVNGCYADQSNEAEAKAVVDLLRDLWCDSSAPPPTIGVVTFNLKQAELIEDRLEELGEKDESFRLALARERDRIQNHEDVGFFVKNVESVQGDERDWIIFSTTFGRDARDRFIRNFGVLGQRGGERRLNVATTRSKDRMVIFTSMPIDEISNVSRSRGGLQIPRDYLQGYMLYAQAVSNGDLVAAEQQLALQNRVREPVRAAPGAHRAFVMAVRDYLCGLGHVIEAPTTQDAFSFDLAIRHPMSGLFAIAIECDTPRHPDLAHARDREIWRPNVLRGSVPNIHRVWARLWLSDGAAERERLRVAVRQALQ
jgi:primosomal replication protein N''